MENSSELKLAAQTAETWVVYLAYSTVLMTAFDSAVGTVATSVAT